MQHYVQPDRYSFVFLRLPMKETVKFHEYHVLIYKNAVRSHLLRFFLNISDGHKGINFVFNLNKGELFIIHLNHTINIHEKSNTKIHHWRDSTCFHFIRLTLVLLEATGMIMCSS